MGSFQGVFSGLTAPSLGAAAIKAAVEKAGLDVSLVEEVLMGCVLPAGLGQAPTRQAALLANLSLQAGCTTISKVCGSGMKATMIGHDGIVANSYSVTVVGGMESMTNSPYLLPKARGGYRLGHGQVWDHMFMDGLEDAYSKENRGRLMGKRAKLKVLTRAHDCSLEKWRVMELPAQLLGLKLESLSKLKKNGRRCQGYRWRGAARLSVRPRLRFKLLLKMSCLRVPRL